MSAPIAIRPSLGATDVEALARKLASLLMPGDTVTLAGEVGAGKTTFARALIGAIAVGNPEVTSPTFALMQSYDVILKGDVKDVLWHVDLYRIEEESELAALGLEELWPHVALIEWPDIAARLLPPGLLALEIGPGLAQDTRSLTVRGDDAWRQRLAELA